MNFLAVSIGLLFMFVGFFFTIATLGFGILCSWPIILIGLILFILGFVVPSRKTTIIHHNPPNYNSGNLTKRVCPNCVRSIQNDAKFCPYCGNEFKEY